MISIGEFREGYGLNHPSIAECVSDSPLPEKARILAYLKGAHVVAASSVRLYDAFTGESIPGEALCYSDGRFTWRSDLCYYFEKYNFILPPAFIRAALAQ